MAKISFTKLGLKKQQKSSTVIINNIPVEVKHYLSVEEKLELIGTVLSAAHDLNFENPIKTDIFTSLLIIEKYTNISFTEKQKENPAKLYDLLVENGIIEKIISEIPSVEYQTLINGIKQSSKAIYEYQNSFVGLMETVKEDYEDLDLNASKIQDKLSNSDNITLLKEILDKLG